MPSGNTSLDLKRPARGIASRHMLKLFFYTSLDYPVCNSAIRRRLHVLFPRAQFCDQPETSYFVSPCAVLQSTGDFILCFPVCSSAIRRRLHTLFPRVQFCNPPETLCFISPCANSAIHRRLYALSPRAQSILRRLYVLVRFTIARRQRVMRGIPPRL